MNRDVPYILAGAAVDVAQANSDGTTKRYGHSVDRWNYKEVYNSAVPYCVGEIATGGTPTIPIELTVGIEDSDNGTTWADLAQKNAVTSHKTTLPKGVGTAVRYVQTTATPWDLRKAKRYVRAYVKTKHDGTGALKAHVGMAFQAADDSPPTNPTTV